MTRRPRISFFHTDDIERQTLAPIAKEAERRQYQVRFTENIQEPAEIGIYCSHRPDPSNAKLSAILLHDLAQRHDVWPNYWQHEPWNRFDIGVLPGPAWSKRWQACSRQPEARPRLGVYELGWPKSDDIFRDPEAFQRTLAKLRTDWHIGPRRSVLYAPSWENDGKQDDLVQSLRDLSVNLLLKQAPWPESYHKILENIRQMNELHRGCADNVYVLDPCISIMACLGLADVLVTEESSVMVEALLLGIPVVAVTDWLIPDRNPPRPAMIPFDFPIRTTRADLRRTVTDLLAHLDQARIDTGKLRDEQFSCLGESALRIMDVLEAAWDGRMPTSVSVTDGIGASVQSGDYCFDPALRIRRRSEYAGITYSDGKATEERILTILKNASDLTTDSMELEQHITDWPSEYHLSAKRGNLLQCLKLPAGSRILELGCGCGAVTRVLGESGALVTAVEGSVRRAVIAAERCRDLPNVSVIADNITTLQLDEQYDVVTLIGVLEYSPMFMGGEDPVEACLRKARSFLKEGGMLIVAIENQLGLKYFAGSSEDHLGKPFYGVGDLYGSGTAITFGRSELRQRLAKAGFKETEFFYPFPDYKLPQVIVSDRARSNPSFRVADLLARISTRDYTRDWQPVFPESLAAQALERNGLLLDLANSFLVVATLEAASPPAWLAVHYSSTTRHASLCLETLFQSGSDGCITVHRRRLHAKQPHPLDTAWRQDVQAVGPYYSGRLLSTELMRLIARQASAQEIAAALRPWVWFLLEHATWPANGGGTNVRHLPMMDAQLPGEFADCTPFNLVQDDSGQLQLFDQEWVHSTPIPICWVLFRGFFHLQYHAFPKVQNGKWSKLTAEIFQQLGLSFERRHDQLIKDYEASLQRFASKRATAGTVLCSIIIPVWNNNELTQQCLKNLADVTDGVSYEVIVVDNGSTDGVQDFLQSLGGDVRVIRNQSNLGFSKACNQGARAARGEFLVFLNNDTIPLKKWLSALVEEVQAHPDVAVVGSKLLYEDGTIQHAGVAFSRECQPYHLYRGVHADVAPVCKRRELQCVTAACLLVRRSVFMQVDGFDEGYRNGFEDVDLCLKIREQKWKVVYQPKSILYHLESRTPGRKKHDVENAKRLRDRWGRAWWLADEDVLTHEDGVQIDTVCQNGQVSKSFRRSSDTGHNAKRDVLVEVQRAALRRDIEAMRRGLQRIEDWPNDYLVLDYAAGLCRYLNEPLLSLEYSKRSLTLHDIPQGRVSLARHYLSEQNFQEAEQHIAYALKMEPAHGEAWLLRGILRMQQQAYAEAETAFEQAIAGGADQRKATLGFIMAAMGNKHAERAWTSATELCTALPDDEEAVHWLLRTGTALEQWEALAPRLATFLARNPANLAMRFALAGVYVRAGRRADAQREYEGVRALDPQFDGLAELAARIAGLAEAGNASRAA